MLTGNPLIRGPLRTYWFTTQPVDYFPLTYTSLWLEWRIWGMNPMGYHVTNVVLHAFSCIFLWRAFVRLNFPSAWLAALLFALHPVTVESVAWIAERKNVLAMFFYSLTVWSFIRFAQSGKRTFYILSLSAFLLSLLAKTAAAAWPIVAFAIGWWILRNSEFSKRNHSSRLNRFTKCTVWSLPFLIVAISLSVATVWFQYNRAIGDDTIHHHDFFTRFAAAGTAVWFYIGKAIVPYPVMFFYPMWNINSHSLISFVPAIALLALFVILWMFRDRWSSPYFFALGYFVLLLAPILGFFNIYFQRYSYVADHWQYFALPAITIMIAAGLNKFKLHYIIGAGLALAFAFLTFNQSRVYRDPQTLWADTYRKNPHSWVALNYLALNKELTGRVDEAIQLYTHSLQLNPEQSESHTGLGKSFCMLGKTNEAMEQYEEAIRINPHHAIPYCNLAGIFQNQGKADEAIHQYREAIRFQPNYAPAYNSLGRLLYMQGRYDEGMAQLRHALAIDPEFPPALINLGVFLTDQNQAHQAVSFCQQAVTLYPDDADAHAALGNALFHLKQSSAAQDQFMAALKLNPLQDLARYGQANCLRLSGRTNEAAKLYEQVIAQNPQHAESHYQLAMLLAANKQKAAAVEHLREAVRLNPGRLEAINNLAWFLATDANSTPTDIATAIRFAEQAVEDSAGRNAVALDTLAVAWARNEIFTKASDTARLALQLAERTAQTNLAVDIQKRIDLYAKRTAYIEP